MNSKTNKLWLPLILVIALALTFGLVMAYAPSMQTANAVIDLQDSDYVNGGEYYAYTTTGNSIWVSDYNVRVEDIYSAVQYDFSAEPSDTVTRNPDFIYPASTTADEFTTLWNINVFESDLSLEW